MQVRYRVGPGTPEGRALRKFKAMLELGPEGSVRGVVEAKPKCMWGKDKQRLMGDFDSLGQASREGTLSARLSTTEESNPAPLKVSFNVPDLPAPLSGLEVRAPSAEELLGAPSASGAATASFYKARYHVKSGVFTAQ